MVDFAALLNKKTEDATRPPPLPAGEYLLQVGKYQFDESDKKKTPYVEFEINILGAGGDVDPTLLQGIDLTKRKLRRTFYLTDDAFWRLRKFIEETLIINGQGRTFNQCLPETVSKQFIGNISQIPSQRPGDDSIFNEIASERAVNSVG